MIDEQFGFVDFGEGIAGFAQRTVEVELFGQDRVGLQIFARLDVEGIAQLCRIGRRVELAQVYRAIGIARPGNDIETDAGILVGAILAGVTRSDRADDFAIVIAIDPQQRRQQFLVLARARRQLGDVLIAIVEFFDRRERFEPVDEVAALGERRLLLRKAEHQRIGQRLDFRVFESDLRRILEQVRELDIAFRFERLERFDLDIVGPCDGHGGQIGDRRFGRQHGFGAGHTLIGALLCPAFGIVDRAVGDQVLKRRRRGCILRNCWLRTRKRREGKTGRKRAARDLSRRPYTLQQARLSQEADRRGAWLAARLQRR